ncbi:hypothetical protein GCM10010492_50480 [Saccharothrix mutabilis subsp. mutabilis]|uniref:Uncharacterized protein n=1 Tax=Saccharothrix mutabilis subsp. mutabilis TaxID=66855 RepID=A0ABN0UBF6_9PSEU
MRSTKAKAVPRSWYFSRFFWRYYWIRLVELLDRPFLVGPAVIALGAAFLVASLPDGTKLLAKRPGWSWLAGPGEAGVALKAALPPVASLLTWINYALAAYLVALVLVSWRHKRPDLVRWGLGVLVVSTFVVHGITWLLVLGRFLVGLVVAFVRWLADLIALMGNVFYDYVIQPVVGLFSLLLGDLAWVGALVVVVVVSAVLGDVWSKQLKRAMVIVGACAVVVGVVVGVVLGLRALFGLVPEWLWQPVVSIGGTVLGWLLAVVACWMAGRLFLDQLRGGAHAGSGRRGVVMGAIAVGSTLAVLMLVGNVHGAYALYPADVEAWARAVLLSDAPKLDATVTLLVIGLCVLGVLRNLGRMRTEPGMEAFHRSLLFTIIGVYVAGGIAGLDKETSN